MSPTPALYLHVQNSDKLQKHIVDCQASRSRQHPRVSVSVSPCCHSPHHITFRVEIEIGGGTPNTIAVPLRKIVYSCSQNLSCFRQQIPDFLHTFRHRQARRARLFLGAALLCYLGWLHHHHSPLSRFAWLTVNWVCDCECDWAGPAGPVFSTWKTFVRSRDPRALEIKNIINKWPAIFHS